MEGAAACRDRGCLAPSAPPSRAQEGAALGAGEMGEWGLRTCPGCAPTLRCPRWPRSRCGCRTLDVGQQLGSTGGAGGSGLWPRLLCPDFGGCSSPMGTEPHRGGAGAASAPARHRSVAGLMGQGPGGGQGDAWHVATTGTLRCHHGVPVAHGHSHPRPGTCSGTGFRVPLGPGAAVSKGRAHGLVLARWHRRQPRPLGSPDNRGQHL